MLRLNVKHEAFSALRCVSRVRRGETHLRLYRRNRRDQWQNQTRDEQTDSSPLAGRKVKTLLTRSELQETPQRLMGNLCLHLSDTPAGDSGR